MDRTSKRIAFGASSVGEALDMFNGDLSVTWLVEGMIEHRAPCLLHAQPKCCKTMLALDLAIACSTGGNWLGRRTTKTNSMIISVENGAKNLLNTITLLCKDRGIDSPKKNLHIGTQLDDISNESVLLELTDYLSRNKIGLVIFDPAYLILGEYRQTEMNDVGSKLYRISTACQVVGATCMFLHHSKNGNTKGLKAAAGAGFANWPSSWMSISRVGRYNLDGKHRLRLEYGGRWAQQGVASIKIDEGVKDDMATICHIEHDDVPVQGYLFPDEAPAPRKQVTRDAVADAIKSSAKPIAIRGIQGIVGGSRQKISDTLLALTESGLIVQEGAKYRWKW